MTDGHLILQDGRQPLGGVQDAVVLHVAAGPDHDGPKIGPQHRPVPDTRASGHGHVADQHRGRGDEGARVHHRAASRELDLQHHLASAFLVGVVGPAAGERRPDPVGARSRMSCCVPVFVDQSTEDVAAT